MANPQTTDGRPEPPAVSPATSHRAASPSYAAPTRRVVVLGASNVSKSFPSLVAAARTFWREPLEILAAHGHGRSYGAAWTRVLMRRIPGILPSGLWETLQRAPALPTSALVTDIGNDLLYGHSVATISGWVEACLDRLAAHQSTTIVTGLPVENISGLTPARYKFFRTLLFPGCELSLGEISDRALSLNERVLSLAAGRGIPVLRPRAEWYGLDPIHLRQRHYPQAWREACALWREGAEHCGISRAKLAESLYLWSRLPQRVQWFGWTTGAAQPSARLTDGTTVALY